LSDCSLLETEYPALPVIPAKAGIQGVVGLTVSASLRGDARLPTFASPFVDHHDGRVVAHWIPAFAGMTAVPHRASMPSEVVEMRRAYILTSPQDRKTFARSAQTTSPRFNIP